MTAALLVALGAGIGAPLRYLWSQALDDRWPIGTLAVNVVGSGLAGLFAALSLSEGGWAFAVTGFCGALTTYSAFVVQSVDRGPRLGGAYAVITAIASITLCFVGFTFGAAL